QQSLTKKLSKRISTSQQKASCLYKSKTSQEWDLAKFLEAIELDEHKNIIFPKLISSQPLLKKVCS
ncbi:8651_t:CDS:2, partial [Gigaspora margarita]